MSIGGVVRRHPIHSYFVATFSISWLGAFCVAAPYLLRREALPKIAGILMFPVMLVGPALSSIVLTRVIDGPEGLRGLFSRMLRASVPAAWYAVLLIPPVCIFAALFVLKNLASPAFAPGFFVIGILFGGPAGYFEEIGWMGFAFPKMRQTRSALSASILLGLLWSLWHWPVIDYLGTAAPHGHYKLHYFLAFSCAMTAMRVVIAWVYSNTGSVLVSQLLHAISTGALVVFSPPAVNARQEALWYFVYSILLWLLVGIICARWRRDFVQRENVEEEPDTFSVAP